MLFRDESFRDELIDADLVRSLLPVVHGEGYKGSRGRIGVFAGAEGTTGAAVLCSQAAARTGAGLVYLSVDRSIYPIVASHLVSVMPRVLDADDPIDLERFDALLVGPGWGQQGRGEFFERLLGSTAPGVLDADGINLLAAGSPIDLGGRWVLTPHPGEMARLAQTDSRSVLEDPYGVSESVARAYRATVVLKSHVTFVTFPDGTLRVMDGMNPYLGTGGSGDVLAGVVAGYLARGATPEEAAVAAVYVHAQAGARARNSGWFLAEDLLPEISRVASDLEEDSDA
jgi:NAD(P)H-hydrate epimerase